MVFKCDWIFFLICFSMCLRCTTSPTSPIPLPLNINSLGMKLKSTYDAGDAKVVSLQLGNLYGGAADVPYSNTRMTTTLERKEKRRSRRGRTGEER